MRLFCKFCCQFRRRFHDDGAIEIAEEFRERQIVSEFHAQFISEGHLCQGSCNSAMVYGFHGSDMAEPDFFIEEIGMGLEYVKVRHAFFVFRHSEEDEGISFFLQFLAHRFRSFARSNCKGNECGRYMEFIEGAAHGVFAANGAQSKGFLHMEGPQKSCGRFAPALFVRQFFEIFLKRQISFSPVRTQGYEAGHREEDGIDGPMERRPGSQSGIIAVGHERSAVRFSLSHREFGHHAVSRGLLISAAERHEYSPCADGGVEPFRKTLLGAVIEIFHGFEPGFFHGFDLYRMEIACFIGLGNESGFYLLGPVRIQEGPGNIDNRSAPPFHDKPFCVRHIGNDGSFQIFFCRIFDELVRICFSDDHGHSFLGFGNSQFRAVETFIFLRYFIQINIETVCQFSDSHGYAAGAEIIAPFDETGHFSPAEKTLDFPFCQRIALLYFSAAGFDGFRIQFLGRPGSAAHSVTARPAAHKDDYIPRRWRKADDMIFRSSSDQSTDFHALCHKARMVIFFDFPRSETNLVAIGAVAFGCFNGDLPLGEFPRKGLGERSPGISRTGDAHGLVYIGTAGKRIPDAAAQTGGRAAEGFDFRRMVVGFILEEKEPVLHTFFRIYLDLDGAGIDFFGLVEIFEFSFLPESLDSCRGHIHEGHGTLRIFAVNMDSCFFIFVQSFRNGSAVSAFFHADLRQLRGESGVTTMVGPVGIEHFDFRHRGVPLFFVPEIVPNHGEIVMAHGKAHGLDEVINAFVIQFCEAFHGRNRFWFFNRKIQCICRFKRYLSRFHRVYQEFQDLFPVSFNKGAVEYINQGTAHPGTVFSRHNGQALFGGVCPLVILPRQEFHAQHQVSLGEFGSRIVYRRFRENGGHSLFIIFIGEAVHVIAMVNGRIGNAISQHLAKLTGEAFLSLTETFFLSYVQTSDIRHFQHSFPSRANPQRSRNSENVHGHTLLYYHKGPPACDKKVGI